MACSSGCKTQDHANWGECVRAKRYVTCYPEAKAYHNFNDGEVQHFRKAAEQEILPDSTRRADVDYAIRFSEQTGRPYRADAENPAWNNPKVADPITNDPRKSNA